MKAGSTAMTQRPGDRVPTGSILALPHSRRPDRANLPTNLWWSLFFFFFDSTGRIYMHWVPTGQTVNKEYYVEVLREFRKRFRRKRPALLKSGQWHFHQNSAPVYNSILVTDYLTKMGIKTIPQPPYRPELAPCDFCLFSNLKEKLRGCRYETIEMKEVVTKVSWHAPTRGLPWGLPEVFGAVEQVHCSRRRILRRRTRVSCVFYQ